MRAKLVKMNPKFFSLDDMPPEPMGPPKSAEELKNDSVARLKVHPNVVLTLWYTIRQLRDEKSFWRPYLDLLPKRIPTPLFWSDDELSIIAGTNLYEGVQQLRSLLRKVWNTLKSVDPDCISLDDVYYAWTLFSSRSFTVSTDRSQDQVHTHVMKHTQNDSDAPALVEPCLVPFADIFNHSNSARVQYITDHKGHTFNLDLETLAQDGQEVFNNYGFKSNESLIIGYGFAILDTEPTSESTSPTSSYSTQEHKPRRQANQHNTNWVQINIDERDPNRAKKMDVIRKRGIAFRHHIKADGEIPPQLLDAMRICLLNSLDLYFLDSPSLSISPKNEEEAKKPDSPSQSHDPLPTTFEREILLYDTLSSLLQNRLEKMEPTDAEEDRAMFLEALRATPTPSWPTIIGWQYRVEQKEILQSALEKVAVLKAELIESRRFNPISESDIFPSVQDDFNLLPLEWRERITSWTLPDAEKPENKEDGKFVVMKVPLDWIICSTTIRKSTLGLMLEKAGVIDDLEEELLIAIFILFQLHLPGQPFHDYFQTVAKACKGRPKYMNALSFVDVDTELLQGTPAEIEVSTQLDAYEQDYRRVFKKLVAPLHSNFQDQNMFAWKHFAWAYSIISCEGQLIPVAVNGDTEEMHLGIIPTFGLRRLHPQEVCELEADDEGSIIISSSKLFSLGGNPNGPHGFYSGCLLSTNDELLRSYGFFVKNHNMDVVPFPLFADNEDHLLDEKMEMLQILRLETDHFLDAVHEPTHIVNSLKILSMDADELKKLRGNIETKPESVQIVTKSQKWLSLLKRPLQSSIDALSSNILAHAESKSAADDAWIQARLDLVMEYKKVVLAVLSHNLSYLDSLPS